MRCGVAVGVLVLVAEVGVVARVGGLAVVGVRDYELEERREEVGYGEGEEVGEDVGGIGRRAICRFTVGEWGMG